MNQIRTSALIGLGALGILFGRKMPGVQVIADEDRIARYSAEPVVCNGEECKFSYVTPAEGRPVDLLLVAVKATVLEQAIQDIAKFVGPDTVILSVLNGITSEEHIDAAYPGHTLWSVAIGMDATRTGRTLVFNQAGKIQFGERDGAMTGRVQAVADYLDECGIANEPCGDILYKQWNKLMVNDGLNQAAAAFDQPYGGLRQPGEAQDMMRAAMQEVIRLANLEGVPLPPDNDVRFIDAMMPTFNPDGMPSMRQDVLAKRPTEVEEFAGVVRQRAKKYGMPTPANDFFYTRIREIEAGIKKEVSVGCAMGRSICSVCGADYGTCEHRKGVRYGAEECVAVLCEPVDAYEFSFVAVPAQREAGVLKGLGCGKPKLKELADEFGAQAEYRALYQQADPAAYLREHIEEGAP